MLCTEYSADFDDTKVPDPTFTEPTYKDENEISASCQPEMPKRGRILPAVIFMAIMLTVGITVYCVTRQPQTQRIRDTAQPWLLVENGTLFYDSTRYQGNGVIIVPASIGGQKITSVAAGCFAGNIDIISVELPEGLTKIGDGAFYGCTGLRGLKLPETLTSMGNEVFADCVWLEAICIPYSLKDVGYDTFLFCDQLRYIFYPGPKSSWNQLNITDLPPESKVYCLDGIIPNG